MAMVWEKWRKTIVIFVAIFIVFLLQEGQAATHWIVTENGRIEQQVSFVIGQKRTFFLKQQEFLTCWRTSSVHSQYFVNCECTFSESFYEER